MNNNLNQTLKAVLIALALLALGYGAYQLYHIAVDDATQKIRAGVTQGVQDGVGKSLNPFRAMGNMFSSNKE